MVLRLMLCFSYSVHQNLKTIHKPFHLWRLPTFSIRQKSMYVNCNRHSSTKNCLCCTKKGSSLFMPVFKLVRIFLLCWWWCCCHVHFEPNWFCMTSGVWCKPPSCPYGKLHIRWGLRFTFQLPTTSPCPLDRKHEMIISEVKQLFTASGLNLRAVLDSCICGKC